MGRQVRMVPANWAHPKYQDDHLEQHLRGTYIPLFDAEYEQAAKEWDEAWSKWQEGLVRDYSKDGEKWRAKEDDELQHRFSEWDGRRPSPDDYMPSWKDEEKTHLMMYENTTEGTPISPALETPEELASWLVDNGASTFGNMSATYEQWLEVCKRGWAPSAMLTPDAGLISGVEASL